MLHYLGSILHRRSSVFFCSSSSCWVLSPTSSSRWSAYFSIMWIIWSTRLVFLKISELWSTRVTKASIASKIWLQKGTSWVLNLDSKTETNHLPSFVKRLKDPFSVHNYAVSNDFLFLWIKEYNPPPQKKKGRRLAHDAKCNIQFSGYTSINLKTSMISSYHLIFNALNMLSMTLTRTALLLLLLMTYFLKLLSYVYSNFALQRWL